MSSVPDGRTLPASVDLSIVVPCYNESGNIQALVERTSETLEILGIAYEMVLVNDGSEDDTWGEIERARSLQPGVVVGLDLPRNGGIFNAWCKGVSQAIGHTVALMDGDLQNPPEALPRLYQELHDSRAAIVQGTRSSIEWDRNARYLSSRGLNLLLNVVFKDHAQDNKSGFLMAPKPVLEDILQFKGQYQFPHTFIRVAARAKGYRIREVETLFLPRKAGKSFLADKPKMTVYKDVIADILKARHEFPRGVGTPPETLEHRLPQGGPPDTLQTPLRERIQKNVYFSTMPLHAWLLRPRVGSVFDALESSQWLSREEIQDLQLSRLQHLVWHCYSNVPYYQRQFAEHGFHPRDLQALDDVRRLPLLSKDAFGRHLYMDLFALDHDKHSMLKIATSGSTGRPFVTYGDRPQLEIRFATTLRALQWTGWRFGDRQVRLWHQRLGMSRSQAMKERLDARLLRRTFIPAFELTESNLKSLVEQLNAIRPTLIDGYAESLNFLSLYLQAGGGLDFVPRGVMSSAQMLTAQTRATIESAMSTRVYDKYGAREFSGIAYQCQFGSDHHVMDESYLVEIIREGRPAKPGELGEVVVTDFNNYSVPMLRYRIGDLAVASDNSVSCQCGRGLGRIGEIQGRTQALVHCANGRWLPGTFFAHFFKEYDHIVAFFQVLQEVKGAFKLLVVRGPQWTSSGWDALMRDLREYVGDSEVVVEFVEEIPLLATGKRTPVVSKVIVDFQSL